MLFLFMKLLTALKKFKIKLFVFLLKDESKFNLLLFGVGRSGTTWVQDLINNDHKFRSIFEPFNRVFQFNLNKEQQSEFNFHSYGRYIAPNAVGVENTLFIEQLFSGKLKDIVFDQKSYFRFKTRFENGRLIKEITGSMFLGYLNQRYPKTPIIYLFRNPYAILLSRFKKGWSTWDFELVMGQKELIENHLDEKLDFIKKINHTDFYLNNFLSIATEYYVVLRELKNKPNVHFFYYEDIKERPAKFLDFLNEKIPPKKLINTKNVDYSKGGSGFFNGKPLNNSQAKNELRKLISKEKLLLFDAIMKAFELDEIYDVALNPTNNNFIHRF